MNHDLWSTEPSALDLLGDNAPTARPMLLDATVMMVDDEPLMTDLIQAHLEDEGYLNFVVTNDPRETMSLLRCNEPGVLLLDLMMPGVSGFDLLTQIRADRELRYTPVIVLTAASGADIKLRALQLGATDFLSKPVDPSELVLRVRNTLAFRQFHERALNFDAVTGLPNQRAFERQLARMLALAEPRGERVGLLRITVAECRQLRETIGQGAADQLMARLAQRLLRIVNAEAAARPGTPERGPTVARLGAEEFGLMLDGLHDVESAEAVARQLVRELAQTVRFGAHEVDPTPFVGIAISPTDGRTGDALLQRAALARSNTQRRGGAHYEFFSAELNARAIERLTLGSQLRRAVERGQLRLHYQPKVDITSQRIIGAEALVRWAHPEQGMVAPGRFIPLAEELGLINGIGDWVLARACHDCARWTREGHAALKVAINVSKAQLEADHLCMVLRQTLRDSGLDPRQLVVELTESMLMDDAQAALALMNEIKALGVTLSIDDFGTGYSSLNYLKRFPIDELKIDRSFVEDLPGGAQDLAIVRAIVSLGQSLGMAVVAEGVETEPQLKALRQLGCDTFQGFLFSRPVPEPEFLALLRPVAESAPAES